MAVPPRLTLGAWAEHALRPLEQRPARHQRELLRRLDDIASGHCDRLMVLMPPGSAKSTYVSVLFPAWWFAAQGRSSVLAASHTAALASHFGRRLRAAITEHADILGYGLARDDRAACRFATTAGGDYFATGLRGPVTGRRADLVVIDDPIKSQAEADSRQQRELTWDWYRSELISRLKPRGRIVLVTTRWHQDDLAGRLLAGGDDWQLLRLPALAETNDPLGRAPGEPLWPEWEDLAALERKRLASGPRTWAAQYQQDPRPDTGALFRTARIATLDSVPGAVHAVRAWDLAATAAEEGKDPDWTVGVKLARDPSGRFLVLDIVRLRGNPHEVERAILETAAADGRAVPIGLPQDPGQAGKQQVAWFISRLAGHRVTATPETGSKLTRAGPAAAQVEAGNLAVLSAPWTRSFLDELADFPTGRKDDQVDALSRAFALLTTPTTPARNLHLPIMGR